MNTLTSNPAAALEVAHQTISDRVHDAEHRALARAARSECRATRSVRTAGRAAATRRSKPLTWWATWFTHPAH